MTVDTKGIVMTPVKDMVHVASIVDATLRKFIKSKMPAGRPARGFGLHPGFRYPDMRLNSCGQSLYTTFEVESDARQLAFHFSCDCDYRDTYPGKKLTMSLGCKGYSVPIIREILSSLTHLGRCYIDECDSDSVPFVEVIAAPRTFTEAVVQGYTTALHWGDWLRVHETLAAKGDAPALAQFMGLTDEELEKVLKSDEAIFKICEAYELAAKERQAALQATT